MTGQLAVRSETLQAVASTPRASQVRELLAAYQEVLDNVDDLPLVPMVLQKHRWRLHYLPRPKWPVRYFVFRHVRRTLASLGRRYSPRAALGQQADGEQHDREAVQEFQESLQPDRQKIYIVLLIGAIVVFFRPIIRAAVPVAIVVTASGTVGNSALREQSLETIQKIVAAQTANATSVNDALNAVLTGGLASLVAMTLGVALSAYVVLRPLVSAFRLKRMLFNVSPERPGRHRSAVARWSVSQATGLYERERRVFAGLGTRPPREFPFDLALSALGMALPLALFALLVRAAVDSFDDSNPRFLELFLAWSTCVFDFDPDAPGLAVPDLAASTIGQTRAVHAV